MVISILKTKPLEALSESSCSSDIDIDECDEDQDICDVMPNSNCANLPGSYVCECNHGFRLNGSVCQGNYMNQN